VLDSEFSGSSLFFFIDLSGQSEFSIVSLTAPMSFINAVVEEVIAADPRLTDAVLMRYEQEVLTQGHYAAEIKFKS
jgi:hypothetical protein